MSCPLGWPGRGPFPPFSLEDAAILSRCIEAVHEVGEPFRRYEAIRLARTSRLQLTSRQNTWGKQKLGPGRVYGYNVWQIAVSAESLASA